MRKGRSTGKPTKDEAAWIVAVKEGPCVACYARLRVRNDGCEAHHLLRGGRRIGHMATVGLCAWHHRGVPYSGNPAWWSREHFGPSLMDGSKLFHDAYGSDEDLMGLQKRILAGTC